MPAPHGITVAQLSRLVGTPESPLVVDVRIPEHREADPRFIPGAIARDAGRVTEWGPSLTSKRVVVVCEFGRKLSEGSAAWLRALGFEAESLEGGHDAWREQRAQLVRAAAVPPRDAMGRTVWVTRARPKIDRIACPWLIRRFIDPHAVFLFVAASEVAKVATEFGATAFDVEGVFLSHRGERCTFDVMIEEFGLSHPALDHLATIVRGADTARLDLVPEAAGLLAASLGYSRMYRSDLEQLDAACSLYDAFYRWSRDARDETHNWPAPIAAARA